MPSPDLTALMAHYRDALDASYLWDDHSPPVEERLPMPALEASTAPTWCNGCGVKHWRGRCE